MCPSRWFRDPAVLLCPCLAFSAESELIRGLHRSLFSHPLDRHLGCFPLLPITSQAAIKVSLCWSICGRVSSSFLSECPRVELVCQRASVCELYEHGHKGLVPLYTPATTHVRSLRARRGLILSVFFALALLPGMIYLAVAFII